VRHPGRVALGGAAVVLSCGVLFARSAIWFWFDEGWFGSGSTLRHPAAALAAMVPAALGVAFGFGVLARAHRIPPPRYRIVAIAAVLVVLLAALATAWYPAWTDADVLAFDSSGAVLWRAHVPATQLFGIRDERDDVVIVEGVLRRRDCEFDLLDITIDRATGAVLDVTELPTSYATSAEVPPPPTEPDPDRYAFDQGSAPVTCSS
jgi:hypothetical protein